MYSCFIGSIFFFRTSNGILPFLQNISVANNDIHTIYVPKPDKPIIKVATILFDSFVTVLPDYKPDLQLFCAKGVLCNMSAYPNATYKWTYACCSGLTVEIIALVMKDLELPFEIYMVKDGLFGGYINGTWNGIINEVYTNRADIGIQGLTATAQRYKDVDFTVGFTNTAVCVIKRKATTTLAPINWKFLELLDVSLIMALLVSSFITTVSIFTFENIGYLLHTRSHFASREIFSYISGLTFQRDIGGKNPLKWSGRIAAIGYATAMTIIMTTYTANLTAVNVINNDANDFKGLSDPRVSGFKCVYYFHFEL